MGSGLGVARSGFRDARFRHAREEAGEGLAVGCAGAGGLKIGLGYRLHHLEPVDDDAPRGVVIHRLEVMQAVTEANLEAARAGASDGEALAGLLGAMPKTPKNGSSPA